MDKKELDIRENLKIDVEQTTEVVFSFDTTGSMSPCIANVRKHIEKTCEQLFETIPNLKVGFIAHGDYCDGANCYALLPLTDDKSEIFKFIRGAPNTSGGDQPECYELALNLARSMGWSEQKGGKIVVLIGDAEPHTADYELNEDRLEWRKELRSLKESGIDVYPLQCLYSPHNVEPNQFWSEIAELCGTVLMKLDTFDDASAMLGAYAAASSGTKGMAAYSSKISLCGLSPETASNIEMLRSVSTKYDTISTDTDEGK